MVAHIRGDNLSSTESHVSNLSINASVRDSLVGQGSSGLSRTGHTVVAVCLGLILVLGVVSNLLVLLVFAKFRSLWTPINLILLNISGSDILVCIFGTPFSFAASLRGRWLIGDRGCMWYGFANSLFGIVSLVSLSVLSYERYTAVLCSTQADVSNFRKSWLCVAGSWFYSLFWTLPPFLGWSSYGPEGVGKINLLSAQRREQHILLMVLSMVTCYLLCWMPYGVMALVATFGRSGLVTPMASMVPSVLAKFSTVVNPVIYVFFNNQFYRCFVAFMKCSGESPSMNSREENQTPGTPLSHPYTTHNRTSLSYPQALCLRTPGNTLQCGPQKDCQALSLVVHYTP